jgi:hypothetical protein
LKIGRYLSVLKVLVGDDGKIEVIEIASKHWNKNGDQMLSIFIDRAMSVRLIDNISIVSWNFTKQNYPRFIR